MAKDIVTYEEYRKELEQQGFEITNPNGLKFALRANQGRRLKDNILEKYTSRKKENAPQTPSEKPQIIHDFADLNKIIETAGEEQTPPPAPKHKKRKRKKTSAAPVEEKQEMTYDEELAFYKEKYKDTDKRVLIIPNKRVFILKEAPQKAPEQTKQPQTQKAEKKKERQVPVSVEEEKNIPQQPEKEETAQQAPVKTGENKSLIEQYVEPLEEWVNSDLDENNEPKRTISYEAPQENKLDITITPSPEQEEKGDSGAVISIEAEPDSESANVKIGAQNNQPLSYEYFYQLLKTAKENGLESVVFDDIKTEAFRTGLLAAALSLNLDIKNAPEGIDLTSEYAAALPNEAKKHLRRYNKSRQRTIKGEKVTETTQRVIERKNNLHKQPPRNPSSRSSRNLPRQREHE